MVYWCHFNWLIDFLKLVLHPALVLSPVLSFHQSIHIFLARSHLTQQKCGQSGETRGMIWEPLAYWSQLTSPSGFFFMLKLTAGSCRLAYVIERRCLIHVVVQSCLEDRFSDVTFPNLKGMSSVQICADKTCTQVPFGFKYSAFLPQHGELGFLKLEFQTVSEKKKINLYRILFSPISIMKSSFVIWMFGVVQD